MVDASQGVEAQTLANAHLAIEAGLEVIPVINKIDLPAAEPDRAAAELAGVLGGSSDEVIRVSAKTGEGSTNCWNGSSTRSRLPQGARMKRSVRWSSTPTTTSTAAWSVTCEWSTDGWGAGNPIRFLATGEQHAAAEVGVLTPRALPLAELTTGEVGYLITGVKEIDRIRVGDTVTSAVRRATEPSPVTPNHTQWCTRGCSRPTVTTSSGCGTPWRSSGSTTPRWSTSRRHLVPSGSVSSCGFLGLLHMEIVRERLEREYDLDLVATAPSVAYRVTTTDGAIHEIRSPQDLPEPNKQHSLEEPYVRAMIIAPAGVHRGHHGVGAVASRRARPPSTI